MENWNVGSTIESYSDDNDQEIVMMQFSHTLHILESFSVGSDDDIVKRESLTQYQSPLTINKMPCHSIDICSLPILSAALDLCKGRQTFVSPQKFYPNAFIL
jgi:hypothetical protein